MSSVLGANIFNVAVCGLGGGVCGGESTNGIGNFGGAVITAFSALLSTESAGVRMMSGTLALVHKFSVFTDDNCEEEYISSLHSTPLKTKFICQTTVAHETKPVFPVTFLMLL